MSARKPVLQGKDTAPSATHGGQKPSDNQAVSPEEASSQSESSGYKTQSTGTPVVSSPGAGTPSPSSDAPAAGTPTPAVGEGSHARAKETGQDSGKQQQGMGTRSKNTQGVETPSAARQTPDVETSADPAAPPQSNTHPSPLPNPPQPAATADTPGDRELPEQPSTARGQGITQAEIPYQVAAPVPLTNPLEVLVDESSDELTVELGTMTYSFPSSTEDIEGSGGSQHDPDSNSSYSINMDPCCTCEPPCTCNGCRIS